jgi:hypothetical protein
VLGARLRQQQIIDDPQYGEREPLDLEARSVLWPHAAQWALIELIQVTEGAARRLEEYRFTPADGRAPAGGIAQVPSFTGPGLPVALLFERTPNGASRTRVYCTPAARAHHLRTLRTDAHLHAERDAADVLARLIGALSGGNPAAALALFEADARLQEPDGALSTGAAAIVPVLQQLYRTSGRAARLCTRLDDGPRTALEVLLEVDRPALVVCERSGGGLLAAVRIYA